MSKYLLLFGFAIAFTACTKKLQKAKTENSPTLTESPKVANSIDDLNKELVKVRKEFTWCKLNADVSVTDASQSYPNVNLNMKMKNKELIYSQVSLFIEVARALITNDSATYLLRMNKSYGSIKMNEISKAIGIKELDLTAMQRLILAEPPFGISKDAKLTIVDKGISIINQTADYKETMIIDSKTFKLLEYRIEKNASQFIAISYSDYQLINGTYTYKNALINAKTPEAYIVKLNIDDLSFPTEDEVNFKIPSGYAKQY
ncbi:MAG: DUF4292 domain-containing protein [Bacteroidota bacterium]|nr:DUF4292 domain-containing protein [Bacteroidota bacterium]